MTTSWLHRMVCVLSLFAAVGCAEIQTGRSTPRATPRTAGPTQSVRLKEGIAKPAPYPGTPREVANVHDACRQGYSQIGSAWVTGTKDTAVAEGAKHGGHMVSVDRVKIDAAPVVTGSQDWSVLLFVPGRSECQDTYGWRYCVGDSDPRYNGGCTLENLKAYHATGVNISLGRPKMHPKLCDVVSKALHNLDYDYQKETPYSAALKRQVNDLLAILKYMLDAKVDPNPRCAGIRPKSPLQLVDEKLIESTMFWDTQDFVKLHQLSWKQWEPAVDSPITSEQVGAYLNEVKKVLVAGGGKP